MPREGNESVCFCGAILEPFGGCLLGGIIWVPFGAVLGSFCGSFKLYSRQNLCAVGEQCRADGSGPRGTVSGVPSGTIPADGTAVGELSKAQHQLQSEAIRQCVNTKENGLQGNL